MDIKRIDKDEIRINSSEDIYGMMQRILLRENKVDRNKEHFWVIGLNQALCILYIELVSMGSTKQTLVEPMNVFRVAVMKGATRVIAVHNHPSGVLNPSGEDKDLTDRLIQVGKILAVEMEDHLIINTEDYLSFKNEGLMKELSMSLKYVPPYLIKDKIKALEETTRKTVNILLNNGMTAEQITEIINITVKEVEAIKQQA